MNTKMEELNAREKEFKAKVAEQEKQFAEEHIKIRMEEREQRCKEEQRFRENLVKEIMNEYNFNQAVAERVVSKGWEDGHYAGYSEVRTMTQIAAEFAEELFKANNC